MLLNYIKTAWRNLRKNRTFSFINIIGLSVSMAVCLLIIMIIADQESFDHFHANRNRIYRVQTLGVDGNDMVMASSALPLGEELRKGYTGIEATASLVRNIGGDLYYQDKVASGGGYFADGGLFRVMDFKLSKGNPATALEAPFSLVISEEIAAQLFPGKDPIGEMVKVNDTGINPGGPETGNRETEYGMFKVTGILQPVEGKTHLPFKLLASLSTIPALGDKFMIHYKPGDWDNVWTNYTYVLMQSGKSKIDLQRALDEVTARVYPKTVASRFRFRAEALGDITPGDAIGNMTHVALPKVVLIVLSILCLIVMLSASLNYTNLSVARSLTRMKEVGVRKVSGASRAQVFRQFITESVLVSLLSLVVALLMLVVLEAVFSGLWINRFMDIRFRHTPELLSLFVAFSLVVGFLAGVLPAIYLSAFTPIQVLKNLSNLPLFRHVTLRRALLVTQYCVSLVFIISALLIWLQTNHLFRFDYGFDKNNVVNVKLYRTENYARFAHAISSNKEVLAVSACAFLPASGTDNGGMVRKADNPNDSVQCSFIDIDAGCLKVWDLKLLAGRNLPAEPSAQGEQYALINENMSSSLGFGSAAQAIGQRIDLGGAVVEVLGVVRDFQFKDVSHRMGPLMLRNRKNEFGYATIRISGRNTEGTLNFLRDSWKQVNPATRFEYQFFDQQVLFMHSMLQDASRILGLLAFLAVLISCLGLLGMASYTAETRRKEVGVRKVLGSGVWQIIILLSKGFLYMLGIAVVIGTPLAYLLNNLWLRFFASRVEIGPAVLGGGILLLMGISLLTVVSQAWSVAKASPVRYLRNE